MVWEHILDIVFEVRAKVMDILDARNEILSKIHKKYEIKLSRYDITYSPEKYGDLSLPCFKISKELNKNPMEIAKELEKDEELRAKFKDIKAVGPYLNFWIDYEKALLEIVESFRTYGKLLIFPKKKTKVLLEHTSANPTGPLHVGRARNPIVGDSIARILRAYGFDVITEYYVDDMGFQIASLVWGCLKYGFPKEESAYEYVKIYRKANEEIESKGLQSEVLNIIRKYENGELKDIFERIVDAVMKDIIASLKRINVEFDSFVKESKFVLEGHVKEVIKKLSEHGLLRRDETGALYVDLKDICPEITKGMKDTAIYLTRSDGTSLYVLRDIAYHLEKSSRADQLINILGEDHKLEGTFIRRIVEILGGKPPEIVFYSFVSLPGGKMSTRKGRVVYLDDFINEAIEKAYEELIKRRPEMNKDEARAISEKIGIGAVRYNIVKVQLEKQITFKWEEALSLEGDSAPFVMYSFVRAKGILNKLNEDLLDIRTPSLEHEWEIKLLRKILQFRDFVEEAALTRRPYIVAKYASDLASTFNRFYDNCPVLHEKDENKKKTRAVLVLLAARALEESFELLGIEMPEKI